METAENISKAAFNRPGTMLICLEGEDGSGLYGTILNAHLKAPVKFRGIAEMILKLDEICDWVGCPQRTAEPRMLNPELKGQYEVKRPSRSDMVKECLSDSNDLEAAVRVLHPKEMVLVSVEYRQNASIQGRVRGKLTDQQSVSFRSGLELMRMFSLVSLEQE